MDCVEFEKLLATFFSEGKVSDEINEEFEDHAYSCDECWAKYESVQDALLARDIDASKKAEEVAKSGIKVLVNGQQESFQIDNDRIKIPLFDKPSQDKKQIKILKGEKEYFSEQLFSADDYLAELAADTGGESSLDETIVLEENINMSGVEYSIEYDSKEQKSYLLIDIGYLK